MRTLLDSVWQRRGTSWLWSEEALGRLCAASEVWSLRRLLRSAGAWPDDLPSNGGDTLVVAGLDGVLDLLAPAGAESWLADDLKGAILSFQDAYDGQAALIFWLPAGAARIRCNPATDEVAWRCAAPHGEASLDFGRILWGAAHEYPQEIRLHADGEPAGLFHLRIT